MTISDFASITQRSPHPDASHHPTMGQVTMETADAAAAGEKQGSRVSRRDTSRAPQYVFIYLFVHNLN